MYHADVIADRVQNLEKAFEVDLVEHPVDLIREFRGRLQHAVDAKSNLVRDLSSEELTFIHNERLMSKASFEYWAERYAFINKQGAEVGPMYPLWESQRLRPR
jgi:hypothetical protein